MTPPERRIIRVPGLTIFLPLPQPRLLCVTIQALFQVAGVQIQEQYPNPSSFCNSQTQMLWQHSKWEEFRQRPGQLPEFVLFLFQIMLGIFFNVHSAVLIENVPSRRKILSKWRGRDVVRIGGGESQAERLGRGGWETVALLCGNSLDRTSRPSKPPL